MQKSINAAAQLSLRNFIFSGYQFAGESERKEKNGDNTY